MPRSLGHRAPLLWLVLPSMAGSTIGHAWGSPPAFVLVPAVALLGFAIHWAGRSPAKWAAALTVALMTVSVVRHRRISPPPVVLAAPTEATALIRIDRIFETEDPAAIAGVGRLSAVRGETGGVIRRVYFHLRLGDLARPGRSAVIRVRGVLSPVPLAPEAASFEAYLLNRGVTWRMQRGSVENVAASAHAFWQLCERARDWCSGVLAAGVDFKRPELAAAYRALVLGQQAELTPEQEELFRRTGTFHIFSISGLHVAAIAEGLAAVLILSRVPRWPRCVATLLLLGAYVATTGAAASALRALVMIAVLEISRAVRQSSNPLAALSVAAAATLLVAPLEIFGASFQLSYGIVAVLLLLGMPMAESWQERWPLFTRLPVSSLRWWHRSARWCWRASLASIAIGLSTALAGALCGIHFFQLFTPGGLLINFVLIPLSSGAILAGLGALLAAGAGLAWLSILFNHSAVVLLLAGNAVLESLVRVPGICFQATYRHAAIGPMVFLALLTVVTWGYAANWKLPGGFLSPFALVAAVLLLGVDFGGAL